ncbi:copper resistance D family protein [Paenibacillus sp. L3-i20]|uniref:copper resistance D family protein n=1 Tax=Paenibacillus sp. L3-i20 TaxID=2905833 RepID=UPI0020BE1EB8|nr:CopD family protein [Paenibacillus sp. L3-i20]
MFIGIIFLPSDVSAYGTLLTSTGHESGAGTTSSVTIKGLVEDILFYGVRTFYYFFLLLATGMMLLGLSIPPSVQGDRQRELIREWSRPVMKGLLIVVLLFVFIQSNKIIRGLEGRGADLLELFTKTPTGQAWLALLIVSLLGFVVIKYKDLYRAKWAMLLLAVESYIGHAAASEHEIVAIITDFIHLACSALWAGGVLLLLLFWRVDRKEAGRFMERFASIAWVTMVVLVVSGIIITWTIIPSWLYLIYTDWGNWLIAKIVVVMLVIGIGAGLRHRARKREMPRGILLKLDGLLMAIIIVIAAVFTSISPMPESEALKVHEMGETLHYTLEITPNAPGPNEVSLTIWLPEGSGVPKAVSLSLESVDGTNQEQIDVPLEVITSEVGIAFQDFTEYNYTAASVNLPSKGKWSAELLITDGTGTDINKVVYFHNN